MSNQDFNIEFATNAERNAFYKLSQMVTNKPAVTQLVSDYVTEKRTHWSSIHRSWDKFISFFKMDYRNRLIRNLTNAKPEKLQHYASTLHKIAKFVETQNQFEDLFKNNFEHYERGDILSALMAIPATERNAIMNEIKTLNVTDPKRLARALSLYVLIPADKRDAQNLKTLINDDQYNYFMDQIKTVANVSNKLQADLQKQLQDLAQEKLNAENKLNEENQKLAKQIDELTQKLLAAANQQPNNEAPITESVPPPPPPPPPSDGNVPPPPPPPPPSDGNVPPPPPPPGGDLPPPPPPSGAPLKKKKVVTVTKEELEKSRNEYTTEQKNAIANLAQLRKEKTAYEKSGMEKMIISYPKLKESQIQTSKSIEQENMKLQKLQTHIANIKKAMEDKTSVEIEGMMLSDAEQAGAVADFEEAVEIVKTNIQSLDQKRTTFEKEINVMEKKNVESESKAYAEMQKKISDEEKKVADLKQKILDTEKGLKKLDPKSVREEKPKTEATDFLTELSKKQKTAKVNAAQSVLDEMGIALNKTKKKVVNKEKTFFDKALSHIRDANTEKSDQDWSN